jgi:hypothetical protein
MPQRKVSRRNTKRKTKKTTKRLSKKRLSKKISSKKKSYSSRVHKYTGKKLLPRRAIIFPEPIMDGGGVDKEMLGL